MRKIGCSFDEPGKAALVNSLASSGGESAWRAALSKVAALWLLGRDQSIVPFLEHTQLVILIGKFKHTDRLVSKKLDGYRAANEVREFFPASPHVLRCLDD